MATKTYRLHMMGTNIEVFIEHDEPDNVFKHVENSLIESNNRFSAHDPNSELMQVNLHAGISPVSVHPELYELIKIGKLHSMVENSSLNIAIGPLVNAWRIGFKDAKVPSEKEISDLLTITNPEHIILDDVTGEVFLQKRNMFIDLGALAKGFIADKMIALFKEQNVIAGLINLGGNVMTYGMSPNQMDGLWRIGIQHPLYDRGNYIATLKTFNQSIVTSGIYERKFTENNQTFHHILDPDTGYPIETDVASLTIVSDQSIDGEIWTGRLFGKSTKEVMQTLERLKRVAGIVITKDGEMVHSDSLKQFITYSASC